MFKSRKMRGFLGAIMLLAAGVTVWLVIARPEVANDRDREEVAVINTDDAEEASDNYEDSLLTQQPDEDEEGVTMPEELVVSGGVGLSSSVALASVVFSATGYVQSRRALKKQ